MYKLSRILCLMLLAMVGLSASAFQLTVKANPNAVNLVKIGWAYAGPTEMQYSAAGTLNDWDLDIEDPSQMIYVGTATDAVPTLILTTAGGVSETYDAPTKNTSSYNPGNFFQYIDDMSIYDGGTLEIKALAEGEVAIPEVTLTIVGDPNNVKVTIGSVVYDNLAEGDNKIEAPETLTVYSVNKRPFADVSLNSMAVTPQYQYDDSEDENPTAVYYRFGELKTGDKIIVNVSQPVAYYDVNFTIDPLLDRLPVLMVGDETISPIPATINLREGTEVTITTGGIENLSAITLNGTPIPAVPLELVPTYRFTVEGESNVALTAIDPFHYLTVKANPAHISAVNGGNQAGVMQNSGSEDAAISFAFTYSNEGSFNKYEHDARWLYFCVVPKSDDIKYTIKMYLADGTLGATLATDKTGRYEGFFSHDYYNNGTMEILSEVKGKEYIYVTVQDGDPSHVLFKHGETNVTLTSGENAIEICNNKLFTFESAVDNTKPFYKVTKTLKDGEPMIWTPSSSAGDLDDGMFEGKEKEEGEEGEEPEPQPVTYSYTETGATDGLRIDIWVDYPNEPRTVKIWAEGAEYANDYFTLVKVDGQDFLLDSNTMKNGFEVAAGAQLQIGCEEYDWVTDATYIDGELQESPRTSYFLIVTENFEFKNVAHRPERNSNFKFVAGNGVKNAEMINANGQMKSLSNGDVVAFANEDLPLLVMSKMSASDLDEDAEVNYYYYLNDARDYNATNRYTCYPEDGDVVKAFITIDAPAPSVYTVSCVKNGLVSQDPVVMKDGFYTVNTDVFAAVEGTVVTIADEDGKKVVNGVKANGSKLTPVNGVYSITIYGDTEIEVDVQGTVGIAGLEADDVDAPVYNLQGMKVADSAANLPAGLYIINGNKVVIK